MKGWRTVLFAIAITAAGSPELLALLPPKVALYVAAAGTIILRAVTNTPIGRSE